MRYFLSSYYPHLILKWVFGTLNKFKWKVLNYKVVDIIEIYNFDFGHFSIRGYLKILNFKCEKLKNNFPWVDDFKWESYQIQSYKLLEIYNFGFDRFSIQGRWKNLNFIVMHLF
jgi:hypothetical protein